MQAGDSLEFTGFPRTMVDGAHCHIEEPQDRPRFSTTGHTDPRLTIDWAECYFVPTSEFGSQRRRAKCISTSNSCRRRKFVAEDCGAKDVQRRGRTE